MSLIEDQLLAEIVAGRSYGGLPRATARAIANIVHLLSCARTLDDITIFARLEPMPDGRFLIPAKGKWAIGFRFVDGLGATECKLQTLGKQWSKKAPNRSRSKRRAKS